jgi:2-polyprenyl-3-methyl-5-hydroxy-6-metoxy-1,4-benzoquinol methylase
MAKLMKEQRELPPGFCQPTALPATAHEQIAWQDANRTWWENHPMRYDWKGAVTHPEFSREFFAEIDKRFFDLVALYAPPKKIPFDWLIDFDSLKTKDVLEIGVGNGSHAQLLASHAGSFCGIDLTAYAVKSTRARMRAFGLDATVQQMDAEQMQFGPQSFDLIWSWGVIHHSANTRRILEEMHRVLRPGGEAIVMVYHRTLWEYYVQGAILAAVSGRLFRSGGIHHSIQRRTDGAIARYYTRSEWKHFVSDLFAVRDMRVYGKKTELVPIPAGGLKDLIVKLIPNPCSRFLTNTCGWGSFLVVRMVKASRA